MLHCMCVVAGWSDDRPLLQHWSTANALFACIQDRAERTENAKYKSLLSFRFLLIGSRSQRP